MAPSSPVAAEVSEVACSPCTGTSSSAATMRWRCGSSRSCTTAGTRVVVVCTIADGLADGGHHRRGRASICADDDDALNLEIALLARQLNPTCGWWPGSPTACCARRWRSATDPGAILDVADLAAPSVVEACLSRTTHTISAAGIEFVVSGTDAPRDAHAARDLRRSRAGGGRSAARIRTTPGEVVACPGRDVRVHEGDWTAMIGTAEELVAQGIEVASPTTAAGAPRVRAATPSPQTAERVLDAVRAFRDDVNPNLLQGVRRVDDAAVRLDGVAAVHLSTSPA